MKTNEEKINFLKSALEQLIEYEKNHPEPGDKVSLDTRVSELERDLKDYPLKTIYGRQIEYRAENFESHSKLIAEIEALQKKVKALEDQHQETNPPFMRIYVEKPIPQGSDPDMTGVRASPYEDVRKFRKPGE